MVDHNTEFCSPILSRDLFFFGVFLPNRWNKANRKYMERITSIQFPEGTKTIETSDNGEFATQGKFKLNESEVTTFLGAHPFDTLGKWHEMRFKEKFFLLSETSRPVINDKKVFRHFQDCKPGNQWTYLLKITSGELWVEVQYPDWGGTGPSCEK
jgi:hypothetical protein